MNRKQFGLIAAVVAAVFLMSGVFSALACGGGMSLVGFEDPQAPKAIVLAAFGSLSQQLGTKLDPTVNPWQWQEDVFGNSSLECPAAGQAVDKTLTRGYRLTISVFAKGKYTDYFFVATKDGHALFQCTNAGPGPNIPLSA